MTRRGPKVALVLDVNVLIDAVDPASAHHDEAIEVLTEEHGLPVYLSDDILRTTANKLLELGADPEAVREYIELLADGEDFHPDVHVVTQVPVVDHQVTDRFGNADYEDSTVVSLVDVAQSRENLPVVLVTRDRALSEWCAQHDRVAVSPARLPMLIRGSTDELRTASLRYLTKRAFSHVTNGPRSRSGHGSSDTRREARRLVADALREHGRPEPAGSNREEIYQRYPELRRFQDEHDAQQSTRDGPEI